MKTLKEHNEEAKRIPCEERESGSAGVLCDKCDAELVFADDFVLCSFPPQRNVVCKICGYTGRMIGE